MLLCLSCPPRCLVWCCPLLFPSSPPSVPSHVACRWLWSERLGHALSDLAIEYHPLAESELINCTEKHFAKAERLHADLEKLVQQRRVDITASRRRMNNLVRELKAMNWVWSRGTDRLFGWQHDLELRAMLEEVCPRPPSLALPCLACSHRPTCTCARRVLHIARIDVCACGPVGTFAGRPYPYPTISFLSLSSF